jgi:hypothetical protein
VHRRSLALYRALLALRLDHPALGGSEATAGAATAPDAESIVICREAGGERFWIAVRFTSGGSIDMAAAGDAIGMAFPAAAMETVLDTEHGEFAADPAPIRIDRERLLFLRPGAIILKER